MALAVGLLVWSSFRYSPSDQALNNGARIDVITRR
jgi:cation transport ATPase-like protein